MELSCEESYKVLFSFLMREISLPNFEKWLYEHDELQRCIPSGAYHELLSIRHRGIGTKLLEFCEKLARSWGAGSIRLETNADNTAAGKLYEKAGFVEFPQRRVFMRFLDP